MTTAWSHLPNAKHIDLILAHVKENPAKWIFLYNATRHTEYNAAWDAARESANYDAHHSARESANYAARIAARGSANESVREAARGAILALIAYDDCGYLLGEKPEHVQMLALLGNPAATLLCPACVAMQKSFALLNS